MSKVDFISFFLQIKVLIERHICCTVSGCLGTFGAVKSRLVKFMTLKTPFRQANFKKADLGGQVDSNG